MKITDNFSSKDNGSVGEGESTRNLSSKADQRGKRHMASPQDLRSRYALGTSKSKPTVGASGRTFFLDLRDRRYQGIVSSKGFVESSQLTTPT